MFISNTYVDNVKTKDLVELGQSLQGMAAGHITFVTVPTGVTDQNGDEPPRTADMRALFDAIINDDPLPMENDQNAQNLGTSPDLGPTNAPTTKKAPTPSRGPGGSAPAGDDDLAARRHGAGVQRDRAERAGQRPRPASSSGTAST